MEKGSTRAPGQPSRSGWWIGTRPCWKQPNTMERCDGDHRFPQCKRRNFAGGFQRIGSSVMLCTDDTMAPGRKDLSRRRTRLMEAMRTYLCLQPTCYAERNRWNWRVNLACGARFLWKNGWAAVWAPAWCAPQNRERRGNIMRMSAKMDRCSQQKN